MARFYESRNIDDSQAQYRIVVRTPDGKRTEINLPRQVFEGIEELQREFWRTGAPRDKTLTTLGVDGRSLSCPQQSRKRPRVNLYGEAGIRSAVSSVPADTRRTTQAFSDEALAWYAHGEDSRSREVLRSRSETQHQSCAREPERDSLFRFLVFFSVRGSVSPT